MAIAITCQVIVSLKTMDRCLGHVASSEDAYMRKMILHEICDIYIFDILKIECTLHVSASPPLTQSSGLADLEKKAWLPSLESAATSKKIQSPRHTPT